MCFIAHIVCYKIRCVESKLISIICMYIRRRKVRVIYVPNIEFDCKIITSINMV